MTEKNAHFTRKLQSSMVTGLMFAHLRQQFWEGGLGVPSDHVTRRKLEETQEADSSEEEVTVLLKRPATSQGSQDSLQKTKRLSKKEKVVKSRNEYNGFRNAKKKRRTKRKRK